MSALALNGRFLTQGLTGVQRFASELTSAMDNLAAAARWPATRVLTPPAASGSGATFGHLETRCVGRTSGQCWEQFELPWHARGRFLLNLGNTAPLLVGRRQAVVIYDASVFDTPESYSPQFRAWYRTLHASLARTEATLITISQFSRGRIAARLGLEPKRVSVIPAGCEHILRAAADTRALSRHGLKPGGYALVVGTPAAHKNLDALADAAALLANRGLTLAVAGAVNPSVFRAPGETLGASAIALGRVSDAELRALYEGALCLVFPSRYEGFGLPPLEAMVCGCPVITTRSAAVPEVCGDAALYFDPAEPGSLTQAIRRLLDEAGLRAELSRRGLARAGQYSWRRSAEALLELIGPAAAEVRR